MEIVVTTDGAVRCEKLQSKYWILLELMVMEVVSGDNWGYKTCKVPVKLSPPTNQHPAD